LQNYTEFIITKTNAVIQNGLRATMLGTSEVFEFTYLLCKTLGKVKAVYISGSSLLVFYRGSRV